MAQVHHPLQSAKSFHRHPLVYPQSSHLLLVLPPPFCQRGNRGSGNGWDLPGTTQLMKGKALSSP